MLYVLDCSVAVKWFVPEESSEAAEAVLARHEAGEIALVAPEVIVAELGHTFRKLVTAGRLNRNDATEGLAEFLSMSIEHAPLRPLADDALRLALTHMATMYDALYIALAERENVAVLTADDGMANAFAVLDRTVRLADLAARPRP